MQSLPHAPDLTTDLRPPDDLWPVTADHGQMAVVLRNLVVNAIQAMASGGTVHIQARNTTVGEGEHHLLPSGDYVYLSVEDEGQGISAEQAVFVFDPFYTTKAKSSGLGLTTAHWIVQRHGGAISVESSLGAGRVLFAVSACHGSGARSIPGDGGHRRATRALHGRRRRHLRGRLAHA